MVLGAVAAYVDSSSEQTVAEQQQQQHQHQKQQQQLQQLQQDEEEEEQKQQQQQPYQAQFQLLQPLQMLQEQLLLPTIRPLRTVSLLEEDATVEPENIRRLLVLGAANVGKTSIVRRFLGHKFSDKYMPTVEDFHRKVGHGELCIQI